MRFLVLDAKHRASRANVLDPMASVHIDQDSLRMGATRPDASLLLVASGGDAPWLEQPTLHLDHQVGVHAISADDEIRLPAVVEAQLHHLRTSATSTRFEPTVLGRTP